MTTLTALPADAETPPTFPRLPRGAYAGYLDHYVLTALTPIAHADPNVGGEGNTTAFLRRRQLLRDPRPLGVLPDQAWLDQFATDFPAPAGWADTILADTDASYYLAVLLLKLVLDLYNRGEGTGLIEGTDRYRRVGERSILAALPPTETLTAWWGRLAGELALPIHPSDADLPYLRLTRVPAGLALHTLRWLGNPDDLLSALAVARVWHRAERDQTQGKPATIPTTRQPLWFDAARQLAQAPSAELGVRVPHLSANGVRHQLRLALKRHLMAELGFEPGEAAGHGPLPLAVDGLLEGGGNIKAGAKQPTNAHALAQLARAAYPSLDLLGGVTDTFDLGESRLKVHTWLVCQENDDVLARLPGGLDLPGAGVPAHQFIERWTHTRQAVRGEGQMIFGGEALIQRSQILVRLDLAPFTPPRVRGALDAAIAVFSDYMALVGGASGRGYGLVDTELLSGTRTLDARTADLAAYSAYLAEARDRLADGLRSGTLTTERVICS